MKIAVLILLVAALALAAVGCANVSAPYVMKTDRIDQKLEEGNRGYLQGTPPPPPDRGDLKRPWIAIDVDLPDSNLPPEAAPVAKEKVVEIKREVTVVREETPTVIKQTTIVKEEEIK